MRAMRENLCTLLLAFLFISIMCKVVPASANELEKDIDHLDNQHFLPIKKKRALLSQRRQLWTERNCPPGGGKIILKEFTAKWGYYGPHWISNTPKNFKWKQSEFDDNKYGYLSYSPTKANNYLKVSANGDSMSHNKIPVSVGNKYYWARRSPQMYLFKQSEIQFNVQSDDYHMFRLIHSNNKADWMGVSNPQSDQRTSNRGCCNQKKMQLTVPANGFYVIAAYALDTGGGDNLYIIDDNNNRKKWTEQGFCRGCLPGFYSDTNDKTSCKECLKGLYQDEHAKNSCKYCEIGKDTTSTGEDSSASCKTCARAKYGSAMGCENCPVGKFGKVVATTGYTQNQRCEVCQEGRYQGDTGEPECKKCSKGFYTSSLGSDDPSDCKACEPGRFNGNDGLVNSVADGGSFKCRSCPAGFFQGYGFGTEEYAPYFKTSSVDGIGSDCNTFAIDDVALSVSDLSACQSKCAADILCQGVSYNSATQTQNCIRRKFACSTKVEASATTTFYGRHLLWSCEACPAATYANLPTSIACKDCSVGYYLETLGSTSIDACISCEAGKYGDQQYTNAAGCKICAGGKYSSVSPSLSCTGICEAGRFAPQSSNRLDHDSSDDCSACPEGYFQPGDGEVRCLGCNGATEEGLTECDGCPPGKKKSGSECIGCVSGKYTDSVNEETCTECPAGYYSESEKTVEATGCEGCFAGYFGIVEKKRTQVDACKKCDAGRFSTLIGSNDASKCLACDAGRYNKEEASPDPSACEPCSPGKWNNNVASKKEDDCNQCLDGTYSATVAAVSINACVQCPIGWYQGEPSQTNCKLCVPGTSQPSVGQKECVSCQPGLYTKVAGSSACVSCDPGKMAPETSMPLCYDCMPGKHAVAPESDICTLCSPGYFQNETKKMVCAECAPGRVASISGMSECSQCGMGQFQNLMGQTKCSECDVGKFADSTGSLSCFLCEAGTFSSRSGTVECPACLPGKRSQAEGSVDCNDCEMGKYENSGSASECVDCETGKSSLMGYVECLKCLPGKIAATIASVFLRWGWG